MKRFIHNLLEKTIILLSPSLYKNYKYKNGQEVTWASIKENHRNPEPLYIPLFLNKEDVFFDIGANQGEFTWMANKIVQDQNIYAFEPIPFLYKKLKAIYKNQSVSNIALSDSNGNHRFKIPIIKGKSYETRGTLNTDYKEDDESDSIEFDVKTQTLDSYCNEYNIKKIDFIKIDVEGAEAQVIWGAENSIKKWKPILFVEMEQRHHDRPVKEIIVEILESFNYQCFYFDLDSTSFVELDKDSDFNSIQRIEFFKVSPALYNNNFFFIPKSKIAEGFIKDVNQKLPN